jgi:uroporphyrin-III C-methyltransferase/precorrin-2 dehydrogenase/sirohydrochlorin ferrochelatase
MQSFPMFIKMTGRRVVIAGGGEQAAQKTRLIMKTEARIILAAPELDAELSDLAQRGRIEHFAGTITADLFRDTALVFIASGCPGLDAALHDLAKSAGALVNVVDQPDLCDATTPSIVDRDPVVVAIGTEGTAPVLARQIKTKVEEMLPPTLGGFAALAGRLRQAVAASVPRAARRGFWAWAFNGAPRATWQRGGEREAARMLKDAIEAGQAPDHQKTGSIALVGAGPGARDLLTLRAVNALQEADVIYYDRLVDPQVLELARRDAERVYVGKTVGAHAWPQDRINGVITAAAAEGKRVVRLKSGDPGIFGRAEEELSAARDRDIPVQIIPGITAASAAAASLGRPLTMRGTTDRTTLVTGMARAGDPLPDFGSLVTPGAEIALYMSVRSAPKIQADMIAAGADPATHVDIVERAATADQRVLSCRLGDLADTITSQGVENPAMILITLPKTPAQADKAHTGTGT